MSYREFIVRSLQEGSAYTSTGGEVCLAECSDDSLVISRGGASGEILGRECCTPECEGKCSGPDGCGRTCPNLCPENYACGRNGECVYIGPLCQLRVEGTDVNDDFYIEYGPFATNNTVHFGFNPVGVPDSIIITVDGVEAYRWCGSFDHGFNVTLPAGSVIGIQVLANCGGAARNTVWGLLSNCTGACECFTFVDPFIGGRSYGYECDYSTNDTGGQIFWAEYTTCIGGGGSKDRGGRNCSNYPDGITQNWGPNCEPIMILVTREVEPEEPECATDEDCVGIVSCGKPVCIEDFGFQCGCQVSGGGGGGG